MPILITGHRGFIGQNMMAALPDAVGYEWGDGPLSLEGIDRVVHLGAISSTACNDLYRLQTQNVDFTLDLLARCAAREIPLQFASSASVYGPKAKTFREADPVAPSNLYAQTKHAIEEYILSRDWPMPVQAFRYFNVYGPHEDHKDQPSPYSLVPTAGSGHRQDRGVRGQRVYLQRFCACGAGGRGAQTVL
jgi:nucleoside-diphosphate-sugar epimerase